MEKLRLNILTQLSNVFDKEHLKIIDNVLTVNMANYDITEKCTSIQIYDDEIPQEIKSFLICKKIKGLSKNTLVQYERTLMHFSVNINKDIKLLSSNDIRLYLLSYEQTRNIGKSALDDKRRILNSFYTWMVNEEIISKNPMVKIDIIKCEKRVKDVLTQLELEKLRMACITNRESALIECLYSTGMRVSELIQLNRTDVDYENAKIKVFGKGHKERWCFLNAKAVLAIKKYIYSRKDQNDALFVSSKSPNIRLGKGTIEKEIKETAKRAGIKKNVTPHTLRRTMATHALANGAALTDIQAMLGHESSQTTLRYAQIDVSNLQTIHKRCII